MLHKRNKSLSVHLSRAHADSCSSILHELGDPKTSLLGMEIVRLSCLGLPAALFIIILPSRKPRTPWFWHSDVWQKIRWNIFTIFFAFLVWSLFISGHQPYEKIIVNSPSKKGHNESETCKFIRTSTLKVNIFDRCTKKETRKSDPYPEEMHEIKFKFRKISTFLSPFLKFSFKMYQYRCSFNK